MKWNPYCFLLVIRDRRGQQALEVDETHAPAVPGDRMDRGHLILFLNSGRVLLRDGVWPADGFVRATVGYLGSRTLILSARTPFSFLWPTDGPHK